MSLFGYLFFLVGLAVLTLATGALGIRAKAVPGLFGVYSVVVGVYAFVVGVSAVQRDRRLLAFRWSALS